LIEDRVAKGKETIHFTDEIHEKQYTHRKWIERNFAQVFSSFCIKLNV